MKLEKKIAITVLSGGLDSTVATATFKDDYQIHALTFDYGQRSAEMEIKSAQAVCKEIGADHTSNKTSLVIRTRKICPYFK